MSCVWFGELTTASGFLVDFLSEPVIAAFMSSAALTISAGQLRVCRALRSIAF
jgi:MFS superfamily sulfate permease-like transporter